MAMNLPFPRGSLVTVSNRLASCYAVWKLIPSGSGDDAASYLGLSSCNSYGIVLDNQASPGGATKRPSNTPKCWTLVAWSHGLVGWTPASLLEAVQVSNELR